MLTCPNHDRRLAMMSTLNRPILARALTLAGAALALAFTAQPAFAAGKAQVQWIEPQNFRDVGFGGWERDRVLKSLGGYFEQLGRRLPDGQVLKLEVTDVDLAGEVRIRPAGELRVLRGGADWPQMALRYTLLSADGRVLKSGQAELSDMSYLFAARPPQAHEGDFPFEKRMIERWFSEQISKPTP
jgi:hypothetical protein